MKVVSKNNYREVNFDSLYYGDPFVTSTDTHPCEELFIKTTDGYGVCVQNGNCVSFSDGELVYDVEATIVVNF